MGMISRERPSREAIPLREGEEATVRQLGFRLPEKKEEKGEEANREWEDGPLPSRLPEPGFEPGSDSLEEEVEEEQV